VEKLEELFVKTMENVGLVELRCEVNTRLISTQAGLVESLGQEIPLGDIGIE